MNLRDLIFGGSLSPAPAPTIKADPYSQTSRQESSRSRQRKGRDDSFDPKRSGEERHAKKARPTYSAYRPEQSKIVFAATPEGSSYIGSGGGDGNDSNRLEYKRSAASTAVTRSRSRKNIILLDRSPAYKYRKLSQLECSATLDKNTSFAGSQVAQVIVQSRNVLVVCVAHR